MCSIKRVIPALALLLSARSAVCQTVDHYPLSPAAQRAAGGPAIYPAGVADPSLSNPPGPLPENGIPLPPTVGPSAGQLMAQPGTPLAAPVWTPGGPPSPSYAPAAISNPGVWVPANAQTQVQPSPDAIFPVDRPQGSWYAREEYYHWNERIGGEDFVNEDGAMTTLGYSRQFGFERFRVEVFGGTVHYAGYDQTPTSLISMSSNTGYLGVRGEYEMVFAPAVWDGRLALLAGGGTRFWIRDLHDGSDNQGNPVSGYQESWWTMYPYIGLQTHMQLGNDLELYTESRAGTTILTYQFVSLNYRPLWPEPGVYANTEIGLRGARYFLAARAEVMSWSPSSLVQGSYQPNSIMYTVGGRFGFTF
jgi:hypothetical protein